MVKNLLANTGDTTDAGLIPGSGRSPRGWNGNPLQYSCLKNSIDRGVWWDRVHTVTKSRKLLSDWAHRHCLPTPQNLIQRQAIKTTKNKNQALSSGLLELLIKKRERERLGPWKGTSINISIRSLYYMLLDLFSH